MFGLKDALNNMFFLSIPVNLTTELRNYQWCTIPIPESESVPEPLHFLLESESESRKPNCAGIGTGIKEFLLESESELESEILKMLKSESESESRHAGIVHHW